jgi:serine phosphatase RsbU (regulator of sigma subunit)
MTLIRAGVILLVVLYSALFVGAWLAVWRAGDYGIEVMYETPAGTGQPFLVESVDPDGPLAVAGIKSGDQLLVDVDLAPPAHQLVVIPVIRAADSASGASARVEAVGVVPRSAISSPIVLGSALVSSAIALPYFLIAVAVALLRPRERAAQLLLLFGTGVAVAQVLRIWLYSVADAHVWNVVNYAVSPFVNVLAFAALAQLFLGFPTQNRGFKRLRRVRPRVLRGWGGPITVCCYAALLLPILLVPIGPRLKSIAYAIVAVEVLVALVALVQSYQRPPNPLVRMQVKWIAWAMGVIFLEVLLATLPAVLSEYHVQLVPLVLIPVFGSALPLAIGFAILRYRLFEVDRIIRLTIVYSVLTGFLLVSYFGCVLVFTRAALALAGPDISTNQSAPLVAAVLTTGLAMPARTRLQAILDQLIFRTRVARSRFLQEATYFLARAQPISAVTEFLTRHAAATLDLQGAWLALPSDLSEWAGRSDLIPPTLSASEHGLGMLQRVQHLTAPAVLSPESALAGGITSVPADSHVLAAWYAAGARVLMPLHVAGPRPARSATPPGLPTNPAPDLDDSDAAGSPSVAIWVLGELRSGDLLDKEDLEALGLVAQRAALLLGYTRFSLKQVRQALLEQDLARAREIQQRLLPEPFAGWPGQLEVASRLQPAREASGDFFDFFSLADSGSRFPPQPMQLTLGDVQGKGIGAALVMGLAHMTLRSMARRLVLASDSPHEQLVVSGARTRAGVLTSAPFRAPSPAATLSLAGSLLHETIGMRDFVACAVAVIEPAESAGSVAPRLRLANAAQVPPLLCREGQVSELVPPGEHLPLGVDAQPEYRELELDLQAGDVVIFASDGLPEAPSAAVGRIAEDSPDTTFESAPTIPRLARDDMYGFERLSRSVRSWVARGTSAQAILDGVWADVTAWSGPDPRHDDMTLLVLRVP